MKSPAPTMHCQCNQPVQWEASAPGRALAYAVREIFCSRSQQTGRATALVSDAPAAPRQQN